MFLFFATSLWVRAPAAAKYSFIPMFNLRIANGAKVGLKLRLPCNLLLFAKTNLYGRVLFNANYSCHNFLLLSDVLVLI